MLKGLAVGFFVLFVLGVMLVSPILGIVVLGFGVAVKVLLQ